MINIDDSRSDKSGLVHAIAADAGAGAEPFTLDTLYGIVMDRKKTGKPGSYTTYLFEKGIDKILKKIGEESAEVIIAAKSDNRAETIYELSDLAYHATVLMVEMGITPDDIKKELASRHGASKPQQE